MSGFSPRARTQSPAQTHGILLFHTLPYVTVGLGTRPTTLFDFVGEIFDCFLKLVVFTTLKAA